MTDDRATGFRRHLSFLDTDSSSRRMITYGVRDVPCLRRRTLQSVTLDL